MPRRKGGLFLPLDVSFWEDPKVVRAGEKAAVLYLRMALAAKRWGTDGELDATQMELLHAADWRKRLVPLLREDLVWKVDENPDRYWLAAWRNHNDPIAVVQARREEDAKRKRGVRASERTPNGHRSPSEPSPSVERSREEKREVRAPADIDCEHGVDRYASCLSCVKQQSA